MRRMLLKSLSFIGYLADKGLIVLCFIFTILFTVLIALRFGVSGYSAYAIIMLGAAVAGCIVASFISIGLAVLGMLADETLEKLPY